MTTATDGKYSFKQRRAMQLSHCFAMLLHLALKGAATNNLNREGRPLYASDVFNNQLMAGQLKRRVPVVVAAFSKRCSRNIEKHKGRRIRRMGG